MIEDFKDLNLPQNLKMKLDMDVLRLFLKRKKKYKRYALLNVIEESFIKVEPTGWGSSNDMAIHEHDDE